MKKQLLGLTAIALLASVSAPFPAIAAHHSGVTVAANPQPSATPKPKKKHHLMKHAAEIGAGAAIIHHEHKKHQQKKAKKAAAQAQPSPSTR